MGQGEPVKPVRNDTSFHVDVRFMSPQAAASTCAGYGVNANIALEVERGCTLYFVDERRCEIVAPTPEYVDDERTRILGHELLHCIAGRYHP